MDFLKRVAGDDRQHSGYAKGFTLVELLVSLGIILLLTAIALSSYPETSTRLTLANVNRSVALLVREAQVKGSAIDSVNSSVGGYGVYADLSTPDRVILFADTVSPGVYNNYGIPVGNKQYDKTSQLDETRSVITFPKGFTLARICVGTGSSFNNCSNTTQIPLQNVAITFVRPDSYPVIAVDKKPVVPPVYSSVCLELHSPRYGMSGHVRSVQVLPSGLISTVIAPCN